MAQEVFTSTEANFLKKTLDKVITDKKYGRDQMIMPKIFKERTMTDNWHDDAEMGGSTLLAKKAEGGEIATLGLTPGIVTRYNAVTYAGKIIVTQEAMEDEKYAEAINAGQRLTTSAFQTVDTQAGLVFVRGWDSAYTGGDGVELFSASHLVPNGSTQSNLMATPMSPSRIAVTVAQTQVAKFVGHNGLYGRYQLKKIVCPVDQKWTWLGIVKSTHAPEEGQFNEINVVNSDMDITVVPNVYWDNTTTNWAALSDCDYPLNYVWRIKPESRTWVDNDQTVMKYSIRFRAADQYWSDFRCAYGVQA